MTYRATLLSVLLVAAVLKLAVWSHYGPVTFNDTHLYTAFADYLQQEDGSWQYRALDQVMPVTTLRMIGYPLLIAAAQAIAGEAWPDLMVALQIAASLAALAAAMGWAHALCGSAAKMAVVGLAVATGQSVLFDLTLLPDSLFSSLMICVLCALAMPGRPAAGGLPAWAVAALCGAAVAVLVLLRANGLHLAILFLPLAVAWVATQPGNRMRTAGLLILPVVITAQAYILWNQHRTGERFLSTGGQLPAFQPLYQAAARGAHLFSGPSTLDKAVRATTRTYAYDDIYTLNRYLAEHEKWTAVDIDRAGKAAFLNALLTEPAAMLRNAGRNFGFDVIRALANPAFTLTETHHLITRERLFPGFSKMVKAAGTLGTVDYVYMAAYAAGAALSSVLFLLFAVAVPLRALMGKTPGGDRLAAGLLWAGCCAVLGYYSFIHLELRYVMPLSPFILALGLWALPRRVRRTGLS